MFSSTVFLLVVVTSILAFVFGSFGNVSTVWLVGRHRGLWHWPHAFHVSLSLADLLALLTITPSLMVLTWPGQLHLHTRHVACVVFGISGIATSIINIITLSEISILRFIRIFRSKRRIPDWFYVISLALPWCVGILMAALAYHTGFVSVSASNLCFMEISWLKHPFINVLIPICLVALLTITVAYGVIIVRLWQLVKHWTCSSIVHPHAAKNQSVVPSNPASHVTPPFQHGHPSTSCHVTRMSNMAPVLRRNKEATVTSFLIVCIFMVSYLPCLVLILIHKVKGTAPSEGSMVTVVLFIYLNNVLNPYVYALRKDAFRHQFVQLLRMLTCNAYLR